ncbi:DUF3298 and DUF4163 domain-containing protein [Niallia nealsonii]|uniref:DUF3298/DUF4163 domain-containing protein n=1 Tax=Niallia nealsonii TaxID=115979 RepID=A0A2N0Z1K0_9BACI|nr:DUF3298 and DUF4163 domain-containing protein [Niallia nealsonii]PKG23383.1 hypothetical protein CWS01_12255 [Niallia nealsonii]
MRSIPSMFICSIIFAFLFCLLPNHYTSAAPINSAAVTAKKYQHNSHLIYPYVSGLTNKTAEKKINAVLTKHIKKSAANYEALMQEMKNMQNKTICKDSPSACIYEYTTNYEVKYNKHNKLSLLLYDYQFTGGAHGSTTVTSYNFNLKTGQRYTLDNLFPTKKVYKKVTAYAKNYMLKKPDIFYPDSKEFSSFQITNQTQFYFADGGIYLIFQQYEVGPYVSGHPTIFIPTSLYKE